MPEFRHNKIRVKYLEIKVKNKNKSLFSKSFICVIFKCTYDLPIVLFGDDEIGNYFNKIEKNRLFFQLKKTEKTFIVSLVHLSLSLSLSL